MPSFLPPLRDLSCQQCPVCGARVAYAPVQPVRGIRWVWCAARCGDEMWPEGEPPTPEPARSTHRGHEIEEQAPDVWVYADTGARVSDDPERDCGACGRAQTDEGHDPCLGELPGVMNACCGHGDAAGAYVQLGPDDVIRGPDALTWIRGLVETVDEIKGVE